MQTKTKFPFLPVESTRSKIAPIRCSCVSSLALKDISDANDDMSRRKKVRTTISFLRRPKNGALGRAAPWIFSDDVGNLFAYGPYRSICVASPKNKPQTECMS